MHYQIFALCYEWQAGPVAYLLQLKV